MTTKTVTFCDNTTYRVGSRVRVSSKFGTKGFGVVTAIDDTRSITKVKVAMDEGTEFGRYDRWPLATGGFYNRISDVGVAGGELRPVFSK